MSRRPKTEASDFWKRLTACWKDKRLPTTQNGIAKKLGMIQGSTRRWFTGAGFPETETLKELADRGQVTIDWLLTGNLPKSPIEPKSSLHRLLEVWYASGEPSRERILEAALGEKAKLDLARQAGVESRSTASLRPAG